LQKIEGFGKFSLKKRNSIPILMIKSTMKSNVFKIIHNLTELQRLLTRHQVLHHRIEISLINPNNMTAVNQELKIDSTF